MDGNEDLKKYPLSIKQQQAGVAILSTLLSACGPIGTAISEGLLNYQTRVKQERLNHFVEGLHKYLEQLNSDEIDQEFVKSEDFAGFFELVLRKVSENKSNEKLEYFRNILLNNIKVGQITDYSEIYLNLVSDLHPKQIEILMVHQRIKNSFQAPTDNSSKESIELLDWFSKFKNDPYTFDLVSKGMLDVHKGERPLYYSTHLLSNYGREFLKFITGE